MHRTPVEVPEHGIGHEIVAHGKVEGGAGPLLQLVVGAHHVARDDEGAQPQQHFVVLLAARPCHGVLLHGT